MQATEGTEMSVSLKMPMWHFVSSATSVVCGWRQELRGRRQSKRHQETKTGWWFWKGIKCLHLTYHFIWKGYPHKCKINFSIRPIKKKKKISKSKDVVSILDLCTLMLVGSGASSWAVLVLCVPIVHLTLFNTNQFFQQLNKISRPSWHLLWHRTCLLVWQWEHLHNNKCQLEAVCQRKKKQIEWPLNANDHWFNTVTVTQLTDYSCVPLSESEHSPAHQSYWSMTYRWLCTR